MGNIPTNQLRTTFTELMIADATVWMILIDKGIIDETDMKYFDAMKARATHMVDQLMAEGKQKHIADMDPEDKQLLEFFGKLTDNSE